MQVDRLLDPLAAARPACKQYNNNILVDTDSVVGSRNRRLLVARPPSFSRPSPKSRIIRHPTSQLACCSLRSWRRHSIDQLRSKTAHLDTNTRHIDIHTTSDHPRSPTPLASTDTYRPHAKEYLSGSSQSGHFPLPYRSTGHQSARSRSCVPPAHQRRILDFCLFSREALFNDNLLFTWTSRTSLCDSTDK